MEKYTVLSFNIGAYEVPHEIKFPSENAKYIMVVDGDTDRYNNTGWDAVVDTSLTGSSFDKCLQVRYNAWRYTDDDIVVIIDGSVGIESGIKLDELVEEFRNGGSDIGIMIHPTRNTMVEEYSAWYTFRNYEAERCNKALDYMQNAGYDTVYDRGLAQLCFQIKRKGNFNTAFDSAVYGVCKFLGMDESDGIERVDQCIYSFVLQKYFTDAKIDYYSQMLYQSDKFVWYPHNSYTPFLPFSRDEMIVPYWKNKEVTFINKD